MNQIYYLCILVGILYSPGRIHAESQDETILPLPDNYNELEKKLFNPDAEKLDSDEVQRLLKQFVELEVDYHHSLEHERIYEAEHILYQCDSSWFSCESRHITDFDSLLQKEKQYTNTIIPLVQKCRSDYISECIRKLEKKTLAEAAKISTYVKDKLDTLKSKLRYTKSTTRDQDLLGDIPLNDLAQGLASYLKTEVPKINTGGDFQQFKVKLNDLMNGDKGFCRNVWRVEPNRLTLDMIRNEKLVDELSSETREWITKAKLCAKMDLESRFLISEVYGILIANDGSKEKKSGVASRMKAKFVK